MRRARSIIGLPIISLQEGLRVGLVRDVVFHPDQRTIAALVVSEATWRHDAELVPVEQIRSMGRDAVTIHSLAGLAKARAHRELYDLLTSGVRLDGLLVMTEGGNYLGLLDEIMVGPHGEMLAYEISTGFAEDVNRGKCLLPANRALTVGRDVATFPENVEELLTSDHADVESLELANTATEVVVLQPVQQPTT